MNRNLLLVLLIVIVAFIIVIVLIISKFNNYSENLGVNSYSAIVKVREDYKNFLNVENVDFFKPYYLKIDMDVSYLSNFKIINDLFYIGYYKEKNKSYIYIKQGDEILKFDAKEPFLNRYYALSVNRKNLVVLDIVEGVIKLILPSKVGGEEK